MIEVKKDSVSDEVHELEEILDSEYLNDNEVDDILYRIGDKQNTIFDIEELIENKLTEMEDNEELGIAEAASGINSPVSEGIAEAVS
jgi:hypothetical protein